MNMTAEPSKAALEALLRLLEPAADGDISMSTAISLKRIADALAETAPKVPPKIIQR
jgi:hypothetical protein